MKRIAAAAIALGVLSLALATGSGPPGVATAQAPYVIEDLGVLPGHSGSVARGINENGDVVGWSNGPDGTRAFVFTDGQGMVELPGLPDKPRSLARDINNAGIVVGNANAGGVDIGHAVRWTNGVPEDLGVLDVGPYSEANAVNDAGAVTGYSYVTIDGHVTGPHAFLYTDADGMVDLTPGDSLFLTGHGKDINGPGQITGYTNQSLAGPIEAFRWADGTLETLGVPTGFAHSFGYAINESGQIAGHARSATGNAERIYRYSDGVGWEELGGVGEFNLAWGINNNGDVVGEGRPIAGLKRAFLFTDAAGMQDLNTLIDPSLGWFLLAATDINDTGQIVGHGFNNFTLETHAFRMTPVDDAEPPAVQFIRPNRMVLSGALPTLVAISASDDVAVAKIEFFVDDQLTCHSTTSTTLVCLWDTRAVERGLHMLKAVATDASGKTAAQEIVVLVLQRT